MFKFSLTRGPGHWRYTIEGPNVRPLVGVFIGSAADAVANVRVTIDRLKNYRAQAQQTAAYRCTPKPR